eukprot:5066742-Prorocentrum_lima.AAC.1
MEITTDPAYKEMLSLIASRERTSQEAEVCLYEQYLLAKRRWRCFTRRPTRRDRFRRRRWSATQMAAPPR